MSDRLPAFSPIISALISGQLARTVPEDTYHLAAYEQVVQETQRFEQELVGMGEWGER